MTYTIQLHGATQTKADQARAVEDFQSHLEQSLKDVPAALRAWKSARSVWGSAPQDQISPAAWVAIDRWEQAMRKSTQAALASWGDQGHPVRFEVTLASKS